MHRRAFIKRATIAAAALALGLATKTKQPEIKRATANPRPNPAWINAPYEASFLFGANAFKYLSPYKGVTFALDPHPLRFSSL